jgi:sugar phosphate isomerase/epimerase
MLLGYNTNGLAHHDLCEAIELLGEEGYRSVAITLDHGALNPLAENLQAELTRVKAILQRWKMHSVIETGARYLLDPHTKHEPTLVSPSTAGRNKRIEFLCRAIDVAAELGSDCVSLWAGVAHDGASPEEIDARLIAGLTSVLDYAAERNVPVGFEPEPGMVIDTMASFASLLAALPHPQLRLTLDIGHLHCQGETPIAEQIELWQHLLVNVHLEDMRAGVHEHLMFGKGEMDFAPIMAALQQVGYDGGVHVELSRHSHAGPKAVAQAREFLRPWFPG